MLGDIKGLVIGRDYKYTTSMQYELASVVLDIFTAFVDPSVADGAQGPILTNVDIGQTSPLLTLPIGALASLDSDSDEFLFSGLV